MCLLHQMCKKFIAGIKIHFLGYSGNILLCLRIGLFSSRKHFSLIIYNFSNMWVNIVIILYVIFVIGRRHKQRIKVNHLNPELFEIIHFIQHALKVTTIKFPHTHGCRIFIPVLYFFCISLNIYILICKYIVCFITIIKTVCINLIHDSTLCPVRSGKSRNQRKLIIHAGLIRCAKLAIIAILKFIYYLKIILNCLFSKAIHRLIIIKHFCSFHQCHINPFSTDTQIHTICICLCRSETNFHFISGIWF